MKKQIAPFITLFFALFFALSLSFTVKANDKFTCEDLTDLANTLDDVAIAITEVDAIEEGDELDQALGSLLEALDLVAKVENETRLNQAVDKIFSAYNNMDRDKFDSALESVTVNLDKLYLRDCQ